MLAHEKGRFVLNASRKSFGFKMVELMIAITIIAIATTLGIHSFRVWIQNTQIRNAAESVQNGMQKAKAEAVVRNTNVAFVLTGVTPGWASSWQVIQVNTAELIDSRSGSEGSKNVTAKGYASTDAAVTTASTTITFSSLGTVVANAPASPTLRRVELDSTVLAAADSHNLRVTVGTGVVGSNVRMCDPNLNAGSSPRAC